MLAALCAGAFIHSETETSCAWQWKHYRIDIGSGAGNFTGSMETYDMSNGADAEQEEEPYNDDFFNLPRDTWAASSRRPQPSRDAADAAGRAAPPVVNP